MENKYLQEAKALAPWLEEIFKHLHQHPELSKQEYETQKFIMAQLEKLGIEATPCADTGVVGVIRGGKPLYGDVKISGMKNTRHSKK